MSALIDISGQKFDLLTVIRAQYIDGKYTGRWECLCDCGNTVYVVKGNLFTGNTKSCGCTRGINLRHDLAGKQYGRWTVLYRTVDETDHHSKWMCECSCGNKKVVYHDNLVHGKTTSCGCYLQEIASNINCVDKTGQQIGHLTVLERVFPDSDERGVKWKCVCSCGKEVVLSTSQYVTE